MPFKIMMGERPYTNPYEEEYGSWLPTPYGRAIPKGHELTDHSERGGTAEARKVKS